MTVAPALGECETGRLVDMTGTEDSPRSRNGRQLQMSYEVLTLMFEILR